MRAAVTVAALSKSSQRRSRAACCGPISGTSEDTAMKTMKMANGATRITAGCASAAEILSPGFKRIGSGRGQLLPALSVQNAQRERLPDSLRAVQHTQFAQDLLHVILRRQRTDLQDHPDLDIALAAVDPLQDLPLPRGENARHRGLHSGALCVPVDLSADPGRVQERHQQFDVIRLPRTDRAWPAGKNKEARHLSGGIVGSMRNYAIGAQPGQLARQGAARKLAPVSRLAIDYLTVVFLPALDEVRHKGHILAEQLAKVRSLHGDRRKAVDIELRRPAIVQGTDQQLMLDQALQRALRPAEELMACAYLERGIQVQHERFQLERIEARRTACSRSLHQHRVLMFSRRGLGLVGYLLSVVYSHEGKVHTASAKLTARFDHSAWCSGPLSS